MRIKGHNTPPVNEFDENSYDGEWLLIRRFLKTMTTDASMKKEEVVRLRKKAYRYFLQNGKIWRVPKRRSDAPLRVITSTEDQRKLILEFQESPWFEHRGTWATLKKLKGKYWWPGMYKSVHDFVTTCENCQMHSVV